MSDARSLITPLVERAYELARSGDCRDAADVDMCLVSEGYYLGDRLERPSVKKDLLRVCREARNERSTAAKK